MHTHALRQASPSQATVSALGASSEALMAQFGVLDGRVARVGRSAAHIGDRLAGVDAARAQVREAVVGAWQDVQTARAVVQAAVDQSKASASALDSVRNEVRVGQRPTVELLDAQRDALAAQDALVIARGEQVIAAYRLNALLHGG